MASLLQRMNIPDAGSVGPQRAKPARVHSSSSSAPYSRPARPDPDAPWQHDKFRESNSLIDRMQTIARKPTASFTGTAARAFSAVGLTRPASAPSLSILGASNAARGNVVLVSGLVHGTSPADVQAIFKQCGPITLAEDESKHTPHARPKADDGVTVRLTFKHDKDAADAVRKFDRQVADGRELRVHILGSRNASLNGRIGAGDGASVDDLIPSAPASKMRSDELIRTDPRAQVLTEPFSIKEPASTSAPARGQGYGRGRGRGARRGNRRYGRGGGGGVERMDTD